jgi:hypothetical protein
MEDLSLLNPGEWASALMMLVGSPVFWGLLAIALIYIILNSKAIAAWLGRKSD